MNQKQRTLRNLLNNSKEGAKLKIISLQGIYNCILTNKIYQNNNLIRIKIKTLENDNPSYEKNKELFVDLNDGGLSEIMILE